MSTFQPHVSQTSPKKVMTNLIPQSCPRSARSLISTHKSSTRPKLVQRIDPLSKARGYSQLMPNTTLTSAATTSKSASHSRLCWWGQRRTARDAVIQIKAKSDQLMAYDRRWHGLTSLVSIVNIIVQGIGTFLVSDHNRVNSKGTQTLQEQY